VLVVELIQVGLEDLLLLVSMQSSFNAIVKEFRVQHFIPRVLIFNYPGSGWRELYLISINWVYFLSMLQGYGINTDIVSFVKRCVDFLYNSSCVLDVFIE
jgi:hypothetical protein